MKFISRSFIPRRLDERFTGKILTLSKYHEYFIRNWLRYNNVR
jgi:hypothetical protein